MPPLRYYSEQAKKSLKLSSAFVKTLTDKLAGKPTRQIFNLTAAPSNVISKIDLKKELALVEEKSLSVKEFIERLLEESIKKAIEIFGEPDTAELNLFKEEYRAAYLSPATLKILEFLRVKKDRKPAEIINLTYEEISVRGLPLFRPFIPPNRVNRSGSAMVLSYNLLVTLVNLGLGDLLHSPLMEDIKIIEDLKDTVQSRDPFDLRVDEEEKLRSGLKRSVIDVNEFVRTYKKHINTRQYL